MSDLREELKRRSERFNRFVDACNSAPHTWNVDGEALAELDRQEAEIATERERYQACSDVRNGLYNDLERAQAENEQLRAALERSLSWLSSYPGGCAEGAYNASRLALQPHTP